MISEIQFWVFWLICGIVPGIIQARSYLEEFKKEKLSQREAQIHKYTMHLWYMDLVFFLLAFMVSCFLWPLVLADKLGTWLRHKKTHKKGNN